MLDNHELNENDELELEEPKKKKRKTSEEKISEIEKKIAQLQEQKKKIAIQQNRKERNARTRRFCTIGGEIEKLLDRKLDDDDIKKLIAFLHHQEIRGKFFSKFMNSDEDLSN